MMIVGNSGKYGFISPQKIRKALSPQNRTTVIRKIRNRLKNKKGGTKLNLLSNRVAKPTGMNRIKRIMSKFQEFRNAKVRKIMLRDLEPKIF
jgi:hypothetical protein